MCIRERKERTGNRKSAEDVSEVEQIHKEAQRLEKMGKGGCRRVKMQESKVGE